jgi:hypothetical protein
VLEVADERETAQPTVDLGRTAFIGGKSMSVDRLMSTTICAMGVVLLFGHSHLREGSLDSKA